MIRTILIPLFVIATSFNILLLSSAFTSTAPSAPAFLVKRSSSSSVLYGMAQPETQIKTVTKQKTKEKQQVVQKQKVSTGEPVSKRKEEFQDAPMYKLMLLGDDSYDTEHVVLRMCSIIEDIDEDQALTVLQQANQEGKAMVGIFPFERAEMFKEQLIRSDPMIFSDLVEENA